MAWSPIHRNLIVLASFTAQLILEGTVLALDVLPPYILKYFRSSNAEVTLFGAVVHGFSQVLGPLSSLIANKIGDRILVILCGIAATFGFAVGSLSTAVWQLVLACAVVGVAFGFAWVPPVTVVSFHFTTHRHMVTSGTTIGGAVGGAIFPFFVSYLLEHEPWQYCFTIMSCVVLQLVVCGALLKRPTVIPRCRAHSIHSVMAEDLTEEQLERAVRKTSVQASQHYLKALALPLFFVSTLMWHVGFDAFEIMPLRLFDEGHTGNKVPLAISLQAITAIGGRLTAALLIGRAHLDPTLTFNAALLGGGLLRVALSWYQEYWCYLIIIALSGFAFGVVVAAVPSVLLEMVGVEKLNTAYGLQLLASGLGGLLGPPLAGWLVDLQGNDDYFVAFLTGGVLILVSTLLMLPYHYPLKQILTGVRPPPQYDMAPVNEGRAQRTP